MTSPRALSLQAFFTLLLIALMMASNHIAARVAFNSGLDVATAVATRSLVTACVVAFLLVVAHVSWHFNRQQGRGLLFVGLMIGLQSQCLYAAVARLPVALAMTLFWAAPILIGKLSRILISP
jgi:drug/metabolite transporter (DMT)-like permease